MPRSPLSPVHAVRLSSSELTRARHVEGTGVDRSSRHCAQGWNNFAYLFISFFFFWFPKISSVKVTSQWNANECMIVNHYWFKPDGKKDGTEGASFENTF